ncbi:tRNA (adenosine(37)-N6)-threonylcarbamoyltransferase complex dimerization subunit type 1 TsaB [Castellaniella sp.]|uniref:tRNA (adenosine(37)-N6)-threonylcarbamoyltransferase complex dimerization subunit type 1 TsaB n=1 Tax=Castellaniella sp. TaxID=1955812 RepID=UPI0035622157
MSTHHLLALETSGHVCSVALLSQVRGRARLRAERLAGRQGHARHVLSLAQGLLDDAQLAPSALSAIAFGQGPGSFTGLRLACGVAQGMALSLGIPVVPVDSLWVLAVQAAGPGAQGIHLVLQDARMHEVYAAAYHAGPDGGWVCVQSPVLLACSGVAAWAAEQSAAWGARGSAAWFASGSALQACPGLEDALAELGATVLPHPGEPDAEVLVQLAEQVWLDGGGLDAALAHPAYVRNKVAYTTLERAGGLGGNPAVGESAVQLHDMAVSDVDEAVAIERQIQAAPWSRRNFIDSLLAGHTGWVLRRMGAMLGFVLLMEAPDMAHVLVIGVRPDVRRQGLGSRLLQACVAHARQAGLPALTLEVRRSNQSAILFYEHHGFQRRGVRRGYYPAPEGREDAWIMTLPLGDSA